MIEVLVTEARGALFAVFTGAGDELMEAFQALTWIRTSNTNVDGLV